MYRGEKGGHVTKLMYQKKSLELVKAEIAKCEVQCANCHRRKTSRENGSYRPRQGSSEQVLGSLKTTQVIGQ
jgi:hypothetical protein